MKNWIIPLALIGGVSLVQAEPTVIFPPNPAQPGHTLIVELESETRFSPILQWNDRTVPFLRSPLNRWRALIRVPLDQQAGPSELLALVRLGSLKTMAVPFKVHLAPSKFGHETIRFSKQKAQLLNDKAEDQESALIRKRLKESEKNKEQFWTGLFLRPVPGKILSPFGIKRNKVGQKKPDFHKGVDFRAGRGDPIQSPNGAKVVLVKDFKFHGKTVLLDHGQGIGSIYLHMEHIKVSEGEKIEKGQVLGTVGSSGLSTAPHLHWGLYVHGEAVDPMQWLETEF